MKVKELIQYLETVNPEHDVVVPVTTLGHHMGGTPHLALKAPHSGFDWDTGRIFLQLEEDVRSVDKSYLKEREMVGRLLDENMSMKMVIKSHGLDKKIAPKPKKFVDLFRF